MCTWVEGLKVGVQCLPVGWVHLNLLLSLYQLNPIVNPAGLNNGCILMKQGIWVPEREDESQ